MAKQKTGAFKIGRRNDNFTDEKKSAKKPTDLGSTLHIKLLNHGKTEPSCD